MNIQAKNDLIGKINKGLALNYQRLIADKRAKNAEIVVMRDNKIVTIKP